MISWLILFGCAIPVILWLVGLVEVQLRERRITRKICMSTGKDENARGAFIPNLVRLFSISFTTVLRAVLASRFRSRSQGDGGVIGQSSPCGALRSLCDLVPSPVLRKRVTKLVADQEFHIDRMLKDGRYKAARFNRVGTWFLFVWYIIEGVVLALAPCWQKRSE